MSQPTKLVKLVAPGNGETATILASQDRYSEIVAASNYLDLLPPADKVESGYAYGFAGELVGELDIASDNDVAKAEQQDEDAKAVQAVAASIIRPADGGPASVLGVVGTFDLAADRIAAKAERLATDQAAVAAVADQLLTTATVLGTTGTRDHELEDWASSQTKNRTLAFPSHPSGYGVATVIYDGTITDPVTVTGQTGITVSADTTVKEVGTSSLKISIGGAVSSKSATIANLPEGTVMGGETWIRVRCSNPAAVSTFRLLAYAATDATGSGYQHYIVNAGNDSIGFKATPWPSNTWRTIAIASERWSGFSTPTGWGDDDARVNYGFRSLKILFDTTDAVDIWIDRIVDVRHRATLMCLIADGWHTTFQTALGDPFLNRGWPVTATVDRFDGAAISGGEGNYPTAAQIAAAVQRGLHVTHHYSGGGTALAWTAAQQVADLLTDRATLNTQLAGLCTLPPQDGLNGLAGNQGGGSYVAGVSQYDLADVLRGQGLRWARGDMSDPQYYYRFPPATEFGGQYASAMPPARGPFALPFKALGSDTEIWASTLLPSFERARRWHSLICCYAHGVSTQQPATGYNMHPNDATAMLAWLDATPEVVPIYPADIYRLTWGRQGDAYLDYSHCWRSRATGLPLF